MRGKVTMIFMRGGSGWPGEIAEMTIKSSGAGLFVCEECEATWFVESEIKTKPFVDLGAYLRSL